MSDTCAMIQLSAVAAQVHKQLVLNSGTTDAVDIITHAKGVRQAEAANV